MKKEEGKRRDRVKVRVEQWTGRVVEASGLVFSLGAIMGSGDGRTEASFVS